MKHSFYKYQGTGNDFILFDDRSSSIHPTAEVIITMCDRRFGIGADGVILLRLSEGIDFEMVYYNADGRLSSMCGNGGRCITSFARMLGLIKMHAQFLAADGLHESEFVSTAPDIVRLKMKDVQRIESGTEGFILDTGSPHLVIQASEVHQLDVKKDGSELRYNERFRKDGVNVNFVEVSGSEIFVRTYERGVEDETLSCGTGVTAAALVARHKGWLENDVTPVNVNCPGGSLKVYAEKSEEGFSDIWLEGPAVFVFKGEYNL